MLRMNVNEFYLIVANENDLNLKTKKSARMIEALFLFCPTLESTSARQKCRPTYFELSLINKVI
jgi:hypothetical protein